MTIDNSLRLARYVSDAARLRLEISPHELDRLGPEGGTDISYAVDTNIVMLYLRPNIVGPRSEGGDGGYGEVFHDAPRESSEALGAVLSRFVFYDLTGDKTPLILLPGHDAEIRGVYDAILRKAGNFLDEVDSQRKKLEAILEEISPIEDLEKKVKVLELRTPAILSCLYFSENAGVELSRFNQLITDCRILRLAFALERWSKTPEEGIAVSHEIRQAYGVPLTLEDQIVESFFRIDWERRLRREKRNLSDRRLKPDCAALARLELINRQLRQRGTGRRLVLVTGDEAMFRAGAQYEPIPEEQRTFSELYLRHPRAFLATPMVVLSGSHPTGMGRAKKADFVTDWLETLLAKYTGDAGVDDARLKDLADCAPELEALAGTLAGKDVDGEYLERLSHVASDNKRNALTLIRRAMGVVRVDHEAPARIRSEREKHFTLLATEHAGASAIGRAAVRKTLHAALDRDVDAALDELNRILSERTDRTWTEFSRALVVAGFELMLDDGPVDEMGKHATRKRNAPPVVIQSCRWAGDFVRRLAGTGDVFGTLREEGDRLESLMEHDPSGYVQSLVFALVFASAEKWHVASLLARRAISIAGRIQREEASGTSTSVPSHVSGREAFYLCSFTVRLGARTESDLLEAELLLVDAEEALGQEHARNQCLSISMARFRAERLALELERHLLLRFGDVAPQTGTIGKPLNKLFECLMRLHDDLKDETDDWLRAHINRRVVTNAFMVAALIEADGSLPANVSDYCEGQYGHLTSVEARSPDGGGVTIPSTRLVSAVADYATARFAPSSNPPAISQIHRRVAKLQQDIMEGDETVLLTCYDGQRFSLLIHSTLSALSSRS